MVKTVKSNIFSASICVGGRWKIGLVESFDACNIYKTRNTHKTQQITYIWGLNAKIF